MDLTTTTERSVEINAASELQQKGLRLIRLQYGSKVPLKDEHWTEPEYGKGFTPADFDGLNIGVRCGDELPGGGHLVIVDLDPRNGGFDAWKFFAQDHDIDEVPETLTVETGGHGLHFYFRAEKPLPKFKLSGGIDIQGVGSYCVAPGSRHESGNLYVIKSDDEIAPLPQCIADAAPQEKPIFDGSTGHFSEVETVDEGGRDNYLTQVGGQLRRSGMTQPVIFAALQATNLEKCKPPLPEKDVARIARSVARYAPEAIELAQLPRKEAEPLLPEKTLSHKKVQQDLEKLFDEADGLVKEIAETILAHSDRQYKHFAIASALAIVSACAQGAYRSPSISSGKTSGGLSLYLWLIAPSAAGKEAYRAAVESYCRAVDERLVFDRFGSSYGLRSSLFCHNSGISVIDEFQDELERLGGKNSSTHLNQVLTEMKELTNDLPELKPVVLAKSKYPGVKQPKYSVFAVGTIEGFQRHITQANTLIGGGLLSRFSVWPVLDVPSRQFQDRLVTPPADQIQRLKEMFDRGLTDQGRSQDPAEELKRFFSIDKEPSVDHRMQHAGAWDIKMDPTAKLNLHDYYYQQEKRYKAYLKQQQAGHDISPGSIADRAPRFALKVASLHALGCARSVVTSEDMAYGKLVATVLSDWLCDMVGTNAASTRTELACKKILATLQHRGRLNRTQIHHACSRHLSARELTQALETLVSCSEIYVFAPGDDKPLACDGHLPKARGLTFDLV